MVRHNDLYGKKISLSYQGKSQMNTVLGGFISMLIKIVLITFFIAHIITVFTYGETRTATKQILKSYLNDKTQYKLMQGTFDIGIAYVSLISGSVGDNLLTDPTYFNVTFSNSMHTRVDSVKDERTSNFYTLDY